MIKKFEKTTKDFFKNRTYKINKVNTEIILFLIFLTD